jgi:hypothetical protein
MENTKHRSINIVDYIKGSNMTNYEYYKTITEKYTTPTQKSNALATTNFSPQSLPSYPSPKHA